MNKESFLINGGLAVDDRGSLRFVNDFNFEGVKRFYQVENHSVGFIRAWHGHHKEGKYVYVVKGSALVGAVSLESEDCQPQRFVLSSQNPKILFIPPGHANGFMTLEENTIVQFFSTSSLQDSLGDDIRFPYNKWDIWGIERR